MQEERGKVRTLEDREGGGNRGTEDNHSFCNLKNAILKM